MKRRIEQLRNGIFEYDTPTWKLSENHIEGTVRKGESFRGSFVIENPAQKKVKGFIYAENPRVGVEPGTFYSISEKIYYEIDTTGLKEGECLEGVLTIVSGIGESKVPYRVEIRTTEQQGKILPFDSLEEFGAMAQKDFQKAYVMFVSGDFHGFLVKKAPGWVLLYEGLMAQSVSYQTLEEFLVRVGQKQPVVIRADQEEANYGVLTQTIQEKITLTKNTWGFLRLDVASDAPFLKVERPIVTTDEFIGSTYTLNYLVDRDELHAGRNYGRITIKGTGQEFVFEVVVHGGVNRGGNKNLKAQHRQVEVLYKTYMDFRLKRISAISWVEKSMDAWEQYTKSGGLNPMMDLIHIHLLFSGGKDEEACLLLDRMEQHKECLALPENRAYFLYLTTFYNKEKKYIDYVEEKISELSYRYPENWKITWFLLYVKESFLRHPAQKLEAIRQQHIYGCASRIMYLEAALVFQQSPLLLKKLESFELKVLAFMVREELWNPELVMQLSELAGRCREYSEELYGILTAVYEKFPSRSLVRAIVGLLLKGRKKGAAYFQWYEKGVEEDVRMAGLYEYYIESMETPIEKPLPQIIRMYFSYNNTLDYKRKAFVYANVIRNKERDPKSYQSYRPAMEKFMVDQLMAGHINEDLAFLYETFVTKNILNRKMAEKLGKLIFTRKVVCQAPWARYVVVRHGQLDHEQKIALKNGQARVQLYTKDYEIFLEDESGNRYAALLPVKITPMIHGERFREYCLDLAFDSAGLLLDSCSQIEQEEGISTETVKDFQRLLSIEGIRETYKQQIRRELLDFYCTNPREESLYDFLHEIDLDLFAATDKSKLIDLLVWEGMCREAFQLVEKYGPEHVNMTSLVGICHRMILSLEYEENTMLLSLCHTCFAKGKYDEIVLTYLLRYYDGPVESMKDLWKAGQKFQADTFILEEKILVLVMFSRSGAENTEQIFDSYRKALGRKMLLSAYVMYRAYDYLVKGEPVKEPVFRYIERGYAKGKNHEDVCLLALLKYYSELEKPDRKQMEYIQNLLEVYTNRGIYMAFFKRFPSEMQRTYQLYDKTIVEYRANPKALVNIRYKISTRGQEKQRVLTEPMISVFEGIFVKEFTLFYGEEVEYTVLEEWNGKISETPAKTAVYSDVDSGKSTQFDLLNQLSEAVLSQNLEDAEFAMLQFKEQEALTEHIFTLV